MSVLPGIVGVLALTFAGGALAWWSGGPSRDLREPATPLRILTLSFVALVGLGSLAIAAGGHTAGPLLVGAAMLAVGLGGWLGARRWGRMHEIPTAIAGGPTRWRVLAAGAAIGAIALGSIVIRSGVPLLTGDAQESRSAFAGLIFDVFRWLVPPAALVVLGWALARPTRRRLASAAATLGGVAAVEVLLASRALPFELGAAGLLIAWWSGHRPRRVVWLGLGVGALALFMGVLFARMDSSRSFRDPLDVLEFMADRTVGRIVLVQAQTVDVAVQTIPDIEPYWAGATYVRRLGAVLGNEAEHPPLGAWLYAHLFPGAPPAFAAPGVLTEGYVNWGPPLALALMALLGLGAQVFGRRLDRLGSGPVDRAAAAVVVVALARTYATSLNGFLLTVAVTAIWWWLARPGSAELVRATLRAPGVTTRARPEETLPEEAAPQAARAASPEPARTSGRQVPEPS
jgi:hypothetical protein